MRKKSKKHKYLAAMVVLSLMAGGVAEARDHQEAKYGEHTVFDIIYFDAEDKGSWVEKFWQRKDDTGKKTNEVLLYDFTADMKNWLKKAGERWAEILSPGISDMKQPAQLIVGNENRANAFAAWCNYDGNDFEQDINNLKNVFVAGKEQRYKDFSSKEAFEGLDGFGFGRIGIGQNIGINQNDGNYGWSGDEVGQLAQQEQTLSLTNVMFHEIAHAMGIFAARQYFDKPLVDDLLKLKRGWVFKKLADDPLDYTYHLLDENGNPARAGQIIVSPDKYKGQEAIIDAHPEKYFQISSTQQHDGDCYKGYAFFKGSHVSDVLEGKTFVGNNNVNIDGIPINGWEGDLAELSHIELERGLMSHQNYRSYNTFMEAELAVMQDIGYNIDRKNFYGRSIYNNDLKGVRNKQGFFARNEAGNEYVIGKPNTATMGVGLHVYGSRNEITQTSDGKNDGSADLLACGDGAAGIRIDGVENTVTLARDANIQANGQNGVGILVAYGRDHQVNVAGNVSAMGDGGDAIRFDFGSNSNGGNGEYRGSFIRYVRDVVGGNIADGGNVLLEDSEYPRIRTNGELNGKMGSLSISGRVAGKAHAIYIAKNAFVDNINIENGAQIDGDIVSDWKHFGGGLYDGGWDKGKKNEKLKIQYKVDGTDKTHYYDEYCKDLVTNLNIKGDFTYAGNITGSDNMKLNVNSGATMNYTGKADVVGVKVDEGASLFGGNYKVNKITKEVSFESPDEEAGKLINHGTIGARNGDSNMNIDGNLENYGTMKGYAVAEQGKIIVTGTADLNEGSKVTAVNGLHGETVNIMQAAGGIAGVENVGSQRTGLLEYRASLTPDGKSLNATAQAVASLEGATPPQARDYENINKNVLSVAQNDPGVTKELRIFYALESDAKALEVIDELGGIDEGDGSDKKAGSTATNDNEVRFKGREDSATAILSAQASSLNGRVLSSRLATAMGQAPAMMHIGASNLTTDNNSGVEIPVQFPQEQDNSAWIRYDRNWGNTASGSSYTGNTYTIGYDWRHGANQRNGWFASYTDSSYGHNDGSENLQDTRIGYYTGINRGADTMLLYADYGYLDGSRSRIAELKKIGTTNIVKGDYTGWLVELGGEWKHALHEPGTKTWQVSPYGAMQMSYMKQHGYSEEGSMKACNVSGGNNFYSALEGGVEFSRYMTKGSLNFRLGLRQALTGTNYETWESNRLTGRGDSIYSPMDKTHFVTSLAVETELAPCWQLGAEVAFQKGAHDKDLMANVQLRWLW